MSPGKTAPQGSEGPARKNEEAAMARKRRKGRKRASERSYARLTRHERNTIERMLDRGKGAREIAREIGRAPSTVANEVAMHRFVTSPHTRRGEPAPVVAELASACPRLGSWPRCCNGWSHGEFVRLPEDERAGAWEMDTVEGSRADSARLLTLCHRPTSFQLAIPVADGTCEAAIAALLGEGGVRPGSTCV